MTRRGTGAVGPHLDVDGRAVVAVDPPLLVELLVADQWVEGALREWRCDSSGNWRAFVTTAESPSGAGLSCWIPAEWVRLHQGVSHGISEGISPEMSRAAV